MTQLSKQDVWVVIPAYLEETVIGGVVEGVRRYFSNVVVVDDGSPDATAKRARQAGAHVVRHPINLGQGASLQTGIVYALLANPTHIATFDGDGQHDARDLVIMFERLVATDADIALGSRFQGRSVGISRLRALLLRSAVAFTRLSTGLPVTDSHNGLRMMTAASAKRIRITQNRMAHASEILSEVVRLGLRLVEVPVTIYYTEYSRQKGQGGLNSINVLLELLSGKMR